MDTSNKVSRTMRRAAGRLRRAGAGSQPGPRAGQQARPAPRTAILVVNGFDRRGRWGEYNESEARDFPWIDLCLRQIERHSGDSSYEILVWDNSFIQEQRRLLRQHPRVRMFGQKEPGRHI